MSQLSLMVDASARKRSLKGHDDNDNRKFLWLANVCNLVCVRVDRFHQPPFREL